MNGGIASIEMKLAHGTWFLVTTVLLHSQTRRMEEAAGKSMVTVWNGQKGHDKDKVVIKNGQAKE